MNLERSENQPYRRSLFKHTVHLLKGETLGFRDEEICERKRDTAKTSPREENFGSEVRIMFISSDKVWSDDTDDLLLSVWLNSATWVSLTQFQNHWYDVSVVPILEVQNDITYIGGSRKTNTTGTNRKREDLSNDDPGNRTPGNGEERDVEANKGNHCRNSRIVVFVKLSSSNADHASTYLRRFCIKSQFLKLLGDKVQFEAQNSRIGRTSCSVE